jgi:hypothetical protein
MVVINDFFFPEDWDDGFSGLEIFIYLFLLYLIKTVCSKSANKADLQYLKRYEGICW